MHEIHAIMVPGGPGAVVGNGNWPRELVLQSSRVIQDRKEDGSIRGIINVDSFYR